MTDSGIVDRSAPATRATTLPSRLTIAIDARLVTRQNTGDTSYWSGLVSGLAELGSGHRFLLYSNAPRPDSVPDVPDLEWVHLPGGHDRWWSLVQFPRAARHAGAQVTHVQYNVSPLAHNPVTTIHDVSFFVDPSWYSPKDGLILRTQIPRSIARSKAVLTVSETSRSEIERYVPGAAGKTYVTPNAVSRTFRPVPREEALSKVRSVLGIQGPYLFTIGSWWPRKNTALAITVSSLLAEKWPHTLAVSGKPLTGDMPGHAVSTGYVDQDTIACLYAGASAYLCTSLHEGFGIPLLEAFASECPVFTGVGGALKEVSAGAACELPDYDPAHWAQTILHTLGDSGKLASMKLAGLNRAKDFDWKSTAAKTVEVYERAAR